MSPPIAFALPQSNKNLVRLVLLSLFLFFIGFALLYFLQNRIEKSYRRTLRERLVEEMMYFPSGKFLKPVVMEYEAVSADLIWLRAIQYYGHHLMTDRKFEWLGHIFEILTQLDPFFVAAYHFGAITLAWDAHEPIQAIRLLRAGIRNNPLNWQIVFDIGFIYYSILDDYDAAGYYFLVASKLPNAWSVLPRWSAFAYQRGGKNEISRQIWTDIYNETDNPAIKDLAERNLALLKVDEDIAVIQAAVNKYRATFGKNPPNLYELCRVGYLKYLPKDPWGGKYVLKDSIVKSPKADRLRSGRF
uniref:Tetratricopeptide repeat protein n=1 Tax=candidate division WOR-3 bacterium TaxID=2052148 RepID=A0A7C6A7Z2_UNCW3